MVVPRPLFIGRDTPCRGRKQGGSARSGRTRASPVGMGVALASAAVAAAAAAAWRSRRAAEGAEEVLCAPMVQKTDTFDV